VTAFAGAAPAARTPDGLCPAIGVFGCCLDVGLQRLGDAARHRVYLLDVVGSAVRRHLGADQVCVPRDVLALTVIAYGSVQVAQHAQQCHQDSGIDPAVAAYRAADHVEVVRHVTVGYDEPAHSVGVLVQGRPESAAAELDQQAGHVSHGVRGSDGVVDGR
jgi:hypothetical protein